MIKRPIDNADPALDDAPKPRAPHFVRRALDAVGITTSASPSLREAEEAARAARVEEDAAAQRARDARKTREAAEQALGPAKARAQSIAEATTREARQRLQGIEQMLAEAKELEANDHSLPSPQIRVRARMLRLAATESASSEEPFSAAAALTSLATLDVVCGAWLNCSQTAGRTMQWLASAEGANASLMVEADTLECAGWSGVMRRIKHLAGEDL